MKRIITYMASGALLIASSCTSYEEEVPIMPAEPTIGKEVPDMVIYEANPRFFGTQNCFDGLTSNLQRIAELGCDVVWIMPVCEPSSEKSVGSPYSIKNYDVVNPRYGTLEDFKKLVSKAHSLGMKVILDWVPNHTGWDNPWIKEHPDWFLHDASGNIVSPPGQGWSDVAQLDYSKPGVAEGMSKAIEYWVAEADVDGFRFDYASSPYIPASFWTDLANDLTAMKSDVILLAETANNSFYQYGYDMIYDWNSAPTISAAFTGGSATTIVEEGQSAWYNVPAGKSILRYAFNHDTASEQSINSFYGSIDAIPAAYVCAAMLNGTPLIYSAMDATGLSGKLSFFDYKQLTFSDDLTKVYAAINKAFKASAEVRRGELQNYSTTKVACFTYSIPGHTMIVGVNTSGNAQKVVSPIVLRGSEMNDLINGATVKVPLEIELGAYEYVIYMN